MGPSSTQPRRQLMANRHFPGRLRCRRRLKAALDQIRQTFFGLPWRVGAVDPGGSNTTAAAAVLAASKHVALANSTAAVLGGTGPVGQRVRRRREGAAVRVALPGICSGRRPSAINTRCSSRTLDFRPGRLALPKRPPPRSGRGRCHCCRRRRIGCCRPRFARNARRSRVAIDLNAVPRAGHRRCRSGRSGRPARRHRR